MKIAKFVLPVIAAGFAASTAMAATSSWEVDNTNTIANVVANKLIADGEGIDWTAAVLVIRLTTGSVHNDAAFGTNSPPNPAFLPLFPTLKWDTYVGILGGVNDVGPLGAGDLGSLVVSLAGNLVSATWGGTDVTNTGPTQIANISLSSDATGTWQLITAFAGLPLLQSGGVVEGGAVVPEPASLALLGLGGLAALRRR